MKLMQKKIQSYAGVTMAVKNDDPKMNKKVQRPQNRQRKTAQL